MNTAWQLENHSIRRPRGLVGSAAVLLRAGLVAALGMLLAAGWLASPSVAEADSPFTPFGTVSVPAAFILDGQGENVDSIAFWEAPDPADTLMFVTAKNNQVVEVWQHPFVANELTPLTHSSFGTGNTRSNGVAVDQDADLIYVSVSSPESTVSVFTLPGLSFVREFISGSQYLSLEPNLALLNTPGGQVRAYVSADVVVYIRDANTGAALGQFITAKGLEAMVADDFYQRVLIPDENDMTGVYVYDPDGNPALIDGANHFGDGGIFQADAEGIALYRCPPSGLSDDGTGFFVVADQKGSLTDFEFFDRQTGAHLGALQIPGVNNTDGIASTQLPMPGYPLGLFAAVDSDTSTVGVGWDVILAATGLECRVTLLPALGTRGIALLGLLLLLSAGLPAAWSRLRRADTPDSEYPG